AGPPGRPERPGRGTERSPLPERPGDRVPRAGGPRLDRPAGALLPADRGAEPALAARPDQGRGRPVRASARRAPPDLGTRRPPADRIRRGGPAAPFPGRRRGARAGPAAARLRRAVPDPARRRTAEARLAG